MSRRVATTSTAEQAKTGGKKKRFLFQPLTCIRQTGIKREWDGTTTYSYVLMVHRDLPPVVITLTVSPTPSLSAQATFDAKMSEAVREVEVQ